jgi:trk system potassium uptake protein TrkH
MFLGLALVMALCAIAPFIADSTGVSETPFERNDLINMGLSALVTAALAAILAFFSRTLSPKKRRIRKRDAVIVVTLIWASVTLVGVLPYVLGTELSLIDALFESASGFTTTGATIFTDIEGMASRPVLLWRSFTQWLGGMGIVVLFVAVFPNMGVGAKHLFRNEVPSVTSSDLKPRITETSSALWKLYVLLTVLAFVTYIALGMGNFDAVCHALTTLGTGGFSTKNASIAAFHHPGIETAVIVFMILGGINFALYYAVLRTRKISTFLRSTEFRVYAALLVSLTLIITLWMQPVYGSLVTSGRRALFMVATTLTSTGYSIDDYSVFGQPVLMIFLFMMVFGGCAGSTSGGLKLSRLILLGKANWMMIRRSVRPSVVHVARMDEKAVPESTLMDVATLCLVYVVCLFGGTFAVTLFDPVSIPTAFGAMLTSLSNMGPAPFHVGEDNFASYSALSKGTFSVAMIVGRLEFFTVLALFLPDTWKH